MLGKKTVKQYILDPASQPLAGRGSSNLTIAITKHESFEWYTELVVRRHEFYVKQAKWDCFCLEKRKFSPGLQRISLSQFIYNLVYLLFFVRHHLPKEIKGFSILYKISFWISPFFGPLAWCTPLGQQNILQCCHHSSQPLVCCTPPVGKC